MSGGAADQWKTAPYRIFLAGPPGSGKGTIGSFLSQEFNLLTISTGDLCREEIAKKSEIGKAIQERVEAGVIRVESKYWLPALIERLEGAPAGGWVLDGAPRWKEQVGELAEAGVTPTLFLLLDISEEECLKRLSSRLIDTHTGAIYNKDSAPPPAGSVTHVRADDRSLDTVLQRIRQSNQYFADVDSWFPPHLVVRIDASLSIAEVQQAVLSALNHSRL